MKLQVKRARSARRVTSWACIAGLALVAAVLSTGVGARAAPTPSLQQVPPFVEASRLIAEDGQRADHFGYAVALDGDTLAVGGPNANATLRTTGDEGAVYVYVRSAGAWTLQQKLTAAGGDTGDHFGHAVALSGNLLVVGAPSARVGDSADQGAVYAFRRSDATWRQDARITGPSGVAGDRFGSALAVSGTRVAVGAPYEEQLNIPDSGVVHLFFGSEPPAGGFVWTETARLTASDAANGDHFGFSVALDGQRLLAGAPGRDAAAHDEGAAYAYEHVGESWTEQRLTAAAPTGNEHFGVAVALDGTDAVVGAPGRDGAGSDQGGAYTFAHAAGAWVAGQTLTAPASSATNNAGILAANNAEFGTAVAVDAGTIAAGAPRASATTGQQGVVYAFDGGQGAWAYRQAMIVPEASAQAHVGSAVAVSGTTIVAGNPDDDILQPDKRVNDSQGSVTAFAEFVAADDAYDVAQREELRIPAPGVLLNDSNPTGGARTAELVTAPAHGNAIQLNPDGSFTYIPQNDFSGADAFTYQAVLPSGRSNVATVTINVHPRPVAVPDSYSTGQDTPLDSPAATGVLANDESGSGGQLTAILLDHPAHGTLTLRPDGSFTYTPSAGYSGPDAFHYRAHDGARESLPTTVSLTVTPPPPPPTANPDAFSVDQDTTLQITAPEGVLANDQSGSGGSLTAVVVTVPAHGTLVLAPDGSFTYTPAAGYNGPDGFRYRASDGTGSAQADVTITVRVPPPVVTPPAAIPDSYSTSRDTSLPITAAAGVLANDAGSTLTASLVTGPAHGTLLLGTNGSFLYTPAAGYSGPDAFSYSASNGAGSSQAIAAIDVKPPPTPPPTAKDDAYAVRADTPLNVAESVGVLANDSGAQIVSLVGAPAHGALNLRADGSFTYAPAAGYEGPDTFSYDASNIAGTDRGDVTLVVLPEPNHPPAAGDDTFTTAQDTTLQIAAAQVVANDADPDGDPLSAANPLPLTYPKHGRLVVADGFATYTPDAGFSGTDAFTYAVSDGRDSSPPADVTVTVAPAAPPDIDGGGGGEVVVPVPPPSVGGPGTPGAPGPPIGLVPGGAPRDCSVRIETVRGKTGALVIAQGSAKLRARRRAAVRTRMTSRGLRALRETVGGVPAVVRAICRTARGEILGDVVRRRALLRVERTVTPPGSWVPDRAVLTPSGKRFVRAVARRLRPLPVSRLRCDGHAALAPTSSVDPTRLSRRRAAVVCGLLRQPSLTARPGVVAHGYDDPIATNATEVGRATNRRAAVTIVYGGRLRTSSRASGAATSARASRWAPPAAAAIPRGRSPQGA